MTLAHLAPESLIDAYTTTRPIPTDGRTIGRLRRALRDACAHHSTTIRSVEMAAEERAKRRELVATRVSDALSVKFGDKPLSKRVADFLLAEFLQPSHWWFDHMGNPRRIPSAIENTRAEFDDVVPNGILNSAIDSVIAEMQRQFAVARMTLGRV